MNNHTIAYERLEDGELLRVWEAHDKAERSARETRRHVEFLLQQRMEQRGASAIPDDLLSCKLERGTPVLDPGTIRGLLELLPTNVLDEGFVPEHEERIWVADRWNLTKVNSWRKYGEDVAEVIEKAKVYANAKLVVKAKAN